MKKARKKRLRKALKKAMKRLEQVEDDVRWARNRVHDALLMTYKPPKRQGPPLTLESAGAILKTTYGKASEDDA